MENVVLALYGLTLAGLAYFAAHRVRLMWLYCRGQFRRPERPKWAGDWPRVCVQCPLYNEPLMVDALLEAVSRLRWPAAKLEIQILDDSADDTSAAIERWLANHPEKARAMKHVRRENRQGYKAGALAAGMAQTDAEFLAVFDADFRPAPDFLEHLIPFFADREVGVVQARWEFVNRRASLLTRFQGLFLDAHFLVEQGARSSAGLFFNFNGTAGIWRRAALVDSGSWSADTVTEDLDASYRAQRRGWRFVYLEDYVVYSELPESLSAFKSQQHRWTKGGVQVARKQLGGILTSSLPGRIKREAFNHLTIGLIHPLLVAFTILFVPYLYLNARGTIHPIWIISPLSVVTAFGTTVMVYVAGQFFLKRQWREGIYLFLCMPLLLAFGLAMSVTGCVAVIEGWFSDGGEFIRTPKGTTRSRADQLAKRPKTRRLFAAITAAEVLIGFVLLAGALYFVHREMLAIALTLVVKASGFLGLAILSTREIPPSSGEATARA